jgi:hypothetical protein
MAKIEMCKSRALCKQCNEESPANITHICANCGKDEYEVSLRTVHYLHEEPEKEWIVCGQECREQLKLYLLLRFNQRKARKLPYFVTEEANTDVPIKVFNNFFNMCSVCNSHYCAYCGLVNNNLKANFIHGLFHYFCRSTDCWINFKEHAHGTEIAKTIKTPYIW